jgi:hypothetical protein
VQHSSAPWPADVLRAGEYEYWLYLMSDSYLGVDQENSFTFTVASGEASKPDEAAEDDAAMKD